MSPERDTSGPAFPAPDLGEQDLGQRGAYPGMSLRDYFAAKAMQSLVMRLAGGPSIGNDHDGLLTHLGEQAYAMADAMLKAGQS